jgi:hypothetical protein
MRSQNEILDLINKLELDGSDPMQVQRKILIRKLSWSNASKHGYINPKYFTDVQQRNLWKDREKLEKKELRKEMDGILDETVAFMFDLDTEKVIVGYQKLQIYIWLLGSKYHSLLREYTKRFITLPNDGGLSLFVWLCKELDFRWDIYDRRYNPHFKSPIIKPEDEDFNIL